MTAAELAKWIHEYNRSCKQTKPEDIRYDQWTCKDCFQIARQVLFSISLEFKKGLTEKYPQEKV